MDAAKWASIKLKFQIESKSESSAFANSYLNSALQMEKWLISNSETFGCLNQYGVTAQSREISVLSNDKKSPRVIL
jgi:hypothetical protein